jgi:SPP1 gp7 family putative phage head morphogenesis protein
MDIVNPKAVLDYWKKKETLPAHQFQKLDARTKAKSFTVAKTWDENFIKDVEASLGKALEKGITAKEWATDFQSILSSYGGAENVGSNEFGSGYLDMVFRTNTQTAYQAGRNSEMFSAEGQARAPYFLWSAIMDDAVDDVCAELDGQVFPKDSYDAQGLTPPAHYNCRCTLIELDEQDLEDGGYTISEAKDVNTEDFLFDNRENIGLI